MENCTDNAVSFAVLVQWLTKVHLLKAGHGPMLEWKSLLQIGVASHGL
jgi:hypothetical protein